MEPPEIETPRLRLRPLTFADASWTLELLNDADYVRFVADRGARTLDDARRYLEQGPLAMYERHGVGLLAIERRSDGAALGVCGLLKRDILPDVDLGFALLPAHRSQGYAREAAEAILAWGRESLGLLRVAAIVLERNEGSILLLRRLGFRRERAIEIEGETLDLYVREEGGGTG